MRLMKSILRDKEIVTKRPPKDGDSKKNQFGLVKRKVFRYNKRVRISLEVKKLANIKSAIKRAELNVKHNEKNSAQKSAMRTAIKAFEANPSEELYRAASSAIDKAETKGLIHKNKANRDKARLAAKLG